MNSKKAIRKYQILKWALGGNPPFFLGGGLETEERAEFILEIFLWRFFIEWHIHLGVTKRFRYKNASTLAKIKSPQKDFEPPWGPHIGTFRQLLNSSK